MKKGTSIVLLVDCWPIDDDDGQNKHQSGNNVCDLVQQIECTNTLQLMTIVIVRQQRCYNDDNDRDQLHTTLHLDTIIIDER